MMNVIFLMAGIGSRAGTLTNEKPKCLLKINGESILERNLSNFEKIDKKIKKCFVLGYKAELIQKYIEDDFVINPFYRITNSIASLWFARDYLNNNSIIMNGDVCISDVILKKIIKQKNGNYIVIDSSKTAMDPVFNPKTLQGWKGEYAGIYRLNKLGAQKMKKEIENCVLSENYYLYHEEALMNLIKKGMIIDKIDIAGERWVEIDTEQDFKKANKIFSITR